MRKWAGPCPGSDDVLFMVQCAGVKGAYWWGLNESGEMPSSPCGCLETPNCSSPRWFVTQGPSKWHQQSVQLDKSRIQQSNWESWLWDGPGFELWVHPPAVFPLGTYSISLDLSVLICKQEPKILTVPLIGLLWKLCGDELLQISIAM